MAKIRIMALGAVLFVVLLFTGCASLTWNSPVTETGTRNGLEIALQNAGAREVARYTRVLGIFNFGQATFNGLVVAEARAGRDVHVLHTRALFWTNIRAFASTP